MVRHIGSHYVSTKEGNWGKPWLFTAVFDSSRHTKTFGADTVAVDISHCICPLAVTRPLIELNLFNLQHYTRAVMCVNKLTRTYTQTHKDAHLHSDTHKPFTNT